MGKVKLQRQRRGSGPSLPTVRVAVPLPRPWEGLDSVTPILAAWSLGRRKHVLLKLEPNMMAAMCVSTSLWPFAGKLRSEVQVPDGRRRSLSRICRPRRPSSQRKEIIIQTSWRMYNQRLDCFGPQTHRGGEFEMWKVLAGLHSCGTHVPFDSSACN